MCSTFFSFRTGSFLSITCFIYFKYAFQVHTGEKPFKCDICEVSFADRFALKRHRSVHEKYARTATNQTNSQGNLNQLYKKKN